MDSTNAISVSVIVVLVFNIYFLRRWALPKPLPGIPYNEESANRIFGDIPLLLKAQRYLWFGQMALKHKSPVFQVFRWPFSKPLVVVADFRETLDICLRRTSEFDVGPNTTEHFRQVIPGHHLTMASSDTRFKHNKMLVRDLMTPTFLNTASAPQIYSKANLLLELWGEKMRLSKGKPFEAGIDIHKYGLDITMAVAFGWDAGRAASLQVDLAHLRDSTNPVSVSAEDEAAKFPKLSLPSELQALLTLTSSVGIAARSLSVRLRHWMLRQTAPIKKALATRELLTSTELKKALARLESGELAAENANSALDSMILRETAAAAKDGRHPDYHSRAIYDELFGFLIAGVDSTTSVMSWGLKFLSRDQSMQHRLREALWEAFPQARAEGRQPSLVEITKTKVPYLDAVIEEMLRHSYPFGFFIRDTLCDTQILGKSIPRGTVLFLSVNGPGMLLPAIEVDEKLRSEAVRRNESQYGVWDTEDIGQFKPERWLKVKKTGSSAGDQKQVVEFDPNAGPLLTFGAGTRACFGKRLAYLELQITFALLIWSFELTEIGGRLNGMEEIISMTRGPALCYIQPKVVPRSTQTLA